MSQYEKVLLTFLICFISAVKERTSETTVASSTLLDPESTTNTTDGSSILKFSWRYL